MLILILQYYFKKNVNASQRDIPLPITARTRQLITVPKK